MQIYSQIGKERTRSECAMRDAAELYKCAADIAVGSHEQQRQDRDLLAQQEAAWAGMLSSAWTFVAMIAALLGLRWIKGTLDATRLGAEASQKAALETARIGEAQVRAYLSATCDDVRYTDDRQIQFRLSITNSGQSPARRVYAILQAGTYNPGPQDPAGTMPLGDIAAAQSIEPLVRLHFSEVLEVFLANNPVARLAIRLTFTDVFNEPRIEQDLHYMLSVHPDAEKPALEPDIGAPYPVA